MTCVLFLLYISFIPSIHTPVHTNEVRRWLEYQTAKNNYTACRPDVYTFLPLSVQSSSAPHTQNGPRPASWMLELGLFLTIAQRGARLRHTHTHSIHTHTLGYTHTQYTHIHTHYYNYKHRIYGPRANASSEPSRPGSCSLSLVVNLTGLVWWLPGAPHVTDTTASCQTQDSSHVRCTH